jgi:hypothetical protein
VIEVASERDLWIPPSRPDLLIVFDSDGGFHLLDEKAATEVF